MLSVKIVDALASTIVCAWVFASAVLHARRIGVISPKRAQLTMVRGVWAELRPFYLPAVVIIIGACVVNGEPGWAGFTSATSLVFWWGSKDLDDDDRWTRRRRRTSAKIRALASGRLTVATE